MIRRSPCELFLKYLLIDGNDNPTISQQCLLNQLDVVGDWYLEDLRAKIKYPTPFYKRDPRHQPTTKFLLAEGVYYFYYPDADMKQAIAAVSKPRVKEFLETALLTGAPNRSTAKRCNELYGVQYSPRVIELYKKHFFDFDLVDSTELTALLFERSNRLERHPNTEIAAQKFSYQKAYYNDARVLAAQMPRTPAAAVLAQIRMGILPTNIDEEKLLETAKITALARLVEIHLTGGRDLERVGEVTRSIEKIDELLKNKGTNDTRLREQLKAVMVKGDTKPVPTLAQLTEGTNDDYTIEVIPAVRRPGDIQIEVDDDEFNDDAVLEDLCLSKKSHER